MAKSKGRFYAASGPVKTYNNEALFKEDFNEPCGLPFGSHSVELGHSGDYMAEMVKPNDLYKGVQASMKDDSKEVRRMTKPHSW